MARGRGRYTLMHGDHTKKLTPFKPLVAITSPSGYHLYFIIAFNNFVMFKMIQSLKGQREWPNK